MISINLTRHLNKLKRTTLRSSLSFATSLSVVLGAALAPTAFAGTKKLALDLHTDAHNFKGIFAQSLNVFGTFPATNGKSAVKFSSQTQAEKRNILNRLVYLFPQVVNTEIEANFSGVLLDSGCPICNIEKKFIGLSSNQLYITGKKWAAATVASSNFKADLDFKNVFAGLQSDLVINNTTKANIPLIVIVPGIFGEFIKSSAFNEVFATGKSSNFGKFFVKHKLQFSSATHPQSRLKRADYTDIKNPHGAAPLGLDKLLKVASIDIKGKTHFRVAVLATDEMTLESVGDNKSRAAMFNVRLKSFLNVLEDIEGVRPKNLSLIGYSRGTGLALEMIAQELKAKTTQSATLQNYIPSLKAVISVGGVVSGSAVADDAIDNSNSMAGVQLAIVTELVNSLQLVSDDIEIDISSSLPEIGVSKYVSSNIKTLLKNTLNNSFHLLPKHAQVAIANTLLFDKAGKQLIRLSLKDLARKIAVLKNARTQSFETKQILNELKAKVIKLKLTLHNLRLQSEHWIITKVVAALKKTMSMSRFSAVRVTASFIPDIKTKAPKTEDTDGNPVSFIGSILTPKGFEDIQGQLQIKADLKFMASNSLNLAKQFGLKFLQFDSGQYNQDVLNFKEFIIGAKTGIQELTTSSRMKWWRTHNIPVAGVKYYNISASFNKPIKGNAIATNRWAYNPDSPDYNGLVDNWKTFVGVNYNDGNNFSTESSQSVKIQGIRLNDSQVAVPRTMFWPNAIAALNPRNAGIKSYHLGVMGTHHWGLALPIVTKTQNQSQNPFPRKALMYAIGLNIFSGFNK